MGNIFPVKKFDRCLLEKSIEFLGKVDAVFQHAAWVRSDQAPLVTLVEVGRDLVPCGIEVPLKLVAPLQNDLVEISGRCLRISGPFGKNRMLCLEGTGVSLELPTEVGKLEFERVQNQLHRIYLPPRARALIGSEAGPERGLTREIMTKTGSQMRLLVTMLCRNVHGPKSFREVVNRLAGLGSGLTPSGDDILVAIAATASYFSLAGWLDRRTVKSLLSEMNSLPPSASTVVGREMITHAVCGSYPQALLRFVTSLGSLESHPEIEARKLALIGGQSGADMLAASYYLTSELLTGYGFMKKMGVLSSREEELAPAALGTFSVWKR